MNNELIKFNESLIEDMKRINLEYESHGYKAPFVFIDDIPCFSGYTGRPKMKNPYVYNPKGIQRLKNLAGQPIQNNGENND